MNPLLFTKSERGFITTTSLIWLIALASVIYGGYKFLPPYAAYYMIKTDIEQEAKNAHMYTDDALARRIITKGLTWDVPVTAKNLKIERGYTTISIELNYEVTLNFFDRYSKTLKFRAYSEEHLKDPSGVLR